MTEESKKLTKEEAAEIERRKRQIAVRKTSQVDLAKIILKKHGAGSYGTGEELVFKAVPRISTGVFGLDYALGGGIPRGRTSIVWGDRSACKSTTMLRIVAMAQMMDRITNKYIWELPDPELAVPMRVAYIDVESALDRPWAEALGVQMEALEVLNLDITEDIGDLLSETLLCHQYAGAPKKKEETDAPDNKTKTKTQKAEEKKEKSKAKSGEVIGYPFDLVIVDSLAAMMAESEDEGSMEDHNVGIAARKNSLMFKKIRRAIAESQKEDDDGHGPTVIVVNQKRHKIGVMWGSPDTKPGGNAQDFYSSVEMKLNANKVEFYDKDRTMPRRQLFTAEILKNKVSPPKIHGEFWMQLVDDPEGLKAGQVDEMKQILDMADRFKMFEDKWQAAGQVFKTKGEMVAALQSDWQLMASFRRDLLKIVNPKQ